ncbi:DUF3306 domain-containing protein [Roseococcus sp. SDR]|uniref:DUF3306 domain-containing protein n=1 Tax=Roseococcus sp. SDR TaxID=2835532 RepID=UPI001BCF6914|nr:DUF3306 domain-containing protein [Roseococcus sp. SDR]MBS7791283.1 DUF3306 domain-containing protein [Roseococcus sp. SDR]MBV1846597.1 DUF3306 domain-containing protein [Roseococcus sp. SDR]
MAEEAEKLGFLSRWSRRKRGEEVPEPPPEPVVEAKPEPQPEPKPEPVAEAPPPEPEFDISTLPPIESLDASSDFTVFLKPGVPQALRTAALRKAWLADPLIRDYMSPLDYAWDFNTPGGLPHGFSNVLAETGEALRKLVNQAIGEMEPEEEKVPDPVALAEAGLPPSEGDPVPDEDSHLVEAPSAPDDTDDMSIPSPIRLSDTPLPAPAPVLEEPPPPPRRRHGGALPA